MLPLNKAAIVGVGLLGGSVGKALKERNLVAEVVGIGRNLESLDVATRLGAIDQATTDIAAGVAGCEVVVVCTPVDIVASQVVEIAAVVGSECLITDVASTKGAIVADIDSQISQPVFVGSHPLAGDHRTGAEHSRADLFAGKCVVVTPGPTTPAELTRRCEDLWQALDANTVVMTPAEHDASLATTSHLPHMVASALALTTTKEVRALAASGWLDTTRVAAADAALWRQIFTSNRGPVLDAIDRFRHHLDALASSLEAEDDRQLEQLLAEGKQIRDAMGS